LRSVVVGQQVTFTATVTNLNGLEPFPSGTVTFEDLTYQGVTPLTNTLAANVPLSNGVASVTSSNLTAGSNDLGNHFITAIYNGDTNFPAGSATLMQKIHANGTLTTVSSFSPLPGSNAMAFTASVIPAPPGSGKPTGMVSFWEGSNFLAQAGLSTNNSVATITNFNPSAGSQAITAIYCGDTLFAASSGNLSRIAPYITGVTRLADGSLELLFTNSPASTSTVLGAIDLDLNLTNWSELGPATETAPGQFQFVDLQAVSNAWRFYRIRSP